MGESERGKKGQQRRRWVKWEGRVEEDKSLIERNRFGSKNLLPQLAKQL